MLIQVCGEQAGLLFGRQYLEKTFPFYIRFDPNAGEISFG